MVGTKSLGLGMALLLAAWLPLAGAGQTGISQSEMMTLITSERAPPVIDVRTPEEFRAGHVPGAINIPLQEFQKRFAELGAYRDRETVMYCESGVRASHGGQWLRSRGFGKLRFLDGHMNAWRDAGLPTEK